MKNWKLPEKKFCKECREHNVKSNIYKVYSDKIMIRLPVDYDETGEFVFYQICKQLEVFICDNKHIWSELNNP